MVKQVLPIVAVVVLIAFGTYFEGRVTERWGRVDSEAQEFTRKLKGVPPVFGDWDSVETPLGEKEFAATNCTDYISRIYKNKTTGVEVSVYMVVGTARNITIHTPDWCYPGAGFTKEEEVANHQIDCGADMPAQPKFSTAVFTKEELDNSQRLRIFWAYSEDGVWEGPTVPTARYAERPALYKVYLITPTLSGQAADECASIPFAEEFMPLVTDLLFGDSSQTDEGTEA